MNWQNTVAQIYRGGIVHYLDDRYGLLQARELGLVAQYVRWKKPTLTDKGRDWMEGRLSIERKGNSKGMHERATWLASLPMGVRL